MSTGNMHRAREWKYWGSLNIWKINIVFLFLFFFGSLASCTNAWTAVCYNFQCMQTLETKTNVLQNRLKIVTFLGLIYGNLNIFSFFLIWPDHYKTCRKPLWINYFINKGNTRKREKIKLNIKFCQLGKGAYIKSIHNILLHSTVPGRIHLAACRKQVWLRTYKNFLKWEFNFFFFITYYFVYYHK